VRILIANDGVGDAGGVQSYLARVIPALRSRGHEAAFLHLDPVRPGSPSPAGDAPHFLSTELEGALDWRPDVAFSHNMRDLGLETRLVDALPVVKFMHGYFGTCIGGQKAHLFPFAVPCHRVLGPACLALYGPRRCGRLSPGHAAHHWSWAHLQRDLFARYRAMVVASGHMRQEYLRNGAPEDRVHALPLFSTVDDPRPAAASPQDPSVVFVGRMTALKGGDLLIRAVAEAGDALGASIALHMVGDGPQRTEWERLAVRLAVRTTFHGWVEAAERDRIVSAASLAAVPSVWPEPFGLAGLEAAALGAYVNGFATG
jgi:glycosyltransferase involved in cell wall biosynthesis